MNGLKYLPRQESNLNGIVTVYQILVSTDGYEWVSVEEDTWAANREWKEANFDAIEARYVRFQVISAESDQMSHKFASAAEVRLLATDIVSGEDSENSGTNTNSSNEVPTKMYITTAGSTQPRNSTDAAIDEQIDTFWEATWDIGSEKPESLVGINLALGKKVTANGSEVSTLGPENVVDGDLTSSNSRWSSPEDNGPHWLQIDLGAVYDVRTVRILWEARKVTSYQIQTSNDSVVWNDAKVIENRPDKTDDIIILEEPVDTRYVRLYIDDFTEEDPDGEVVAWNTVSVYEMEIYSDIYQSNVNESNKVYATQTFIDAHANFVQENGVFETMLNQYDLSTLLKSEVMKS